MGKRILTINQVLLAVLFVVGAIALTAMASDYAGKIQLKVGPDGVQLEIDGTPDGGGK